MATSNTYVGPPDGWTLVRTAGGVGVRISCVPANQTFYVYGGASLPAADVIGVQVNCGCFQLDNTVTDNFYVRLSTNVPGSTLNNGKARIDVYAGA